MWFSYSGFRDSDMWFSYSGFRDSAILVLGIQIAVVQLFWF